jgi:hypothetical protein
MVDLPPGFTSILLAPQAAYVQTIAQTRGVARYLWAAAQGIERPADIGEFVSKANNESVSLLGSRWIVQSGGVGGVTVSKDGSRLIFRAKSGDHASFDPPRKIRAELTNTKTYAKGEAIRLKGSFWIDPATSIATTDWCSIIQIHPADTRFANGVPVSAAPIFSMGLILQDGHPMLQVRAETGTGVPAPNTFSPLRVLGGVPLRFGIEHTFDFTFIDGHGGSGAVNVSIDGRPVVHYSGPTGYEYVDLLASTAIRGKRQPTDSYLKVGIYSGKSTGDEPPANAFVRYLFTLSPN